MGEDPIVEAALGIARTMTGPVEEIVAYFHPDAVVHASPGWPEPGPFRGHKQIVEQFRRLVEDYREEAARAAGMED